MTTVPEAWLTGRIVALTLDPLGLVVFAGIAILLWLLAHEGDRP